jgi:hypothetical protein
MATRRTADEQASDRAEIAKLLLQRVPHREIARRLHRSGATIHADVRAIEAAWHAEQVAATAERKDQTARTYELVLAEAWEAWEASKGEHLVETTRIQIVGGRPVTTGERRTEQSPGDPRYLDKVLAATNGLVELFGLKAPYCAKGTLTHEHRVITDWDAEMARLMDLLGGGDKGAVLQPGDTLPRGFGAPR